MHWFILYVLYLLKNMSVDALYDIDIKLVDKLLDIQCERIASYRILRIIIFRYGTCTIQICPAGYD